MTKCRAGFATVHWIAHYRYDTSTIFYNINYNDLITELNIASKYLLRVPHAKLLTHLRFFWDNCLVVFFTVFAETFTSSGCLQCLRN